MEVKDNKEMISLVKQGKVNPGDTLIDAKGDAYIKMESASTALRTCNGKVFVLGCVPYPIQVEEHVR